MKPKARITTEPIEVTSAPKELETHVSRPVLESSELGCQLLSITQPGAPGTAIASETLRGLDSSVMGITLL